MADYPSQLQVIVMRAFTLFICLFFAASFVSAVQAGEIIWDFGPLSGEYGGAGANQTDRFHWADDVSFDSFIELTGIDIWTPINSHQGDFQIKILFTAPFTEAPGSDYLRWNMPASRFAYDGKYGGTDLYKISFDFAPVLLRADTRYWIGVSSNGWNVGQARVRSPGDDQAAYFKGLEFSHMSDFGDQMFQLRGRVVAPPFELTLEGVCPGEMTASVIGATPGGEVAIIYGQCGGETALPPGSPCPGAILPVGEASLINIVRADDEGSASVTGAVPDSVCGEICLVALDLDTCRVSTFARTYRRPELYVGEQMNIVEGFADFNDPGQYYLRASYDEGGMNFRYVHQDLPGFRSLTYCGGDGTPGLYMGGPRDMMGVTRVDQEPIGAIEFNAGDGWVDNCKFTYLWIRVYQDGLVIADYTYDLPRWQTLGLRGGDFDEIRLGGFSSAASRDFAYETQNERSLQALVLDNVSFGMITPVTLTLTGACPGTMTADATGATPGGQVAFIRGTCDEQTTIPGGPCAGTVLPIGAPQIVATITADQAGAARITGDLPAAACGGQICLAALDLTTCGVSNAQRIE